MKAGKIKEIKKSQGKDSPKSSKNPDTFSLEEKLRELSKSFAANPYFLYGSIAAAVITTVLYYPYVGFADYDIWYHLKFGEHFVTNKTFQLDHSMFSWTPADPNWKYGIWLGSSFLYLLYSFAGIYGLELFKWFVIFSIAGLYFYYCISSKDKIDITNITLAFLAVTVVNTIASMVKPDNFTLLFFALIVFIYFHTKLYHKKLFYFYPLVFLIWVNTHGGFLVGLFFITLALFGDMLTYLLKREDAFPKRHIFEFAIIVVFSYIATLLNPYGLGYHLYIIPTYFKGEIMGYAGRVFAFSSLWKYLFTDYFRLRDSFIAAIVLIAIFMIISIYLFRRNRFFDAGIVVLNLAFFYLGSNTSRVISFFAIIAVFSMAYIVKKSDALDIKRNIGAISALILIFMASMVTYDLLTKTTFRSWFPTNMDDVLPDKEIGYIKKFGLPQPIFNDYLIGGYLIWALYPEYKVFIDPRYGPYWKETGPDYFNFESNATEYELKKFNQKYPFKTAVFHYAAVNFIKLFMRSDEWKLMYFDDIAAVFVRKDAIDGVPKDAFKEDISPDRFRNFTEPVALQAIFTIYANLGAVEYAGEILDIYNKNVSDLYYQKNADMSGMQAFLNKVKLRNIKLNR